MPDGSTRKVKTGTSGGYLTGVVHQKYMDVVCAMTQQGSSTTYYCDEFIPSSAAGRVVYRSNNNANANAGVCRANCGNDSSNTNTNIGSRLGNSPKDKKLSAYRTGYVYPNRCRGG